ncbi:MAG: hypothetical protein P8176_02090 [Gammaproteobacteria bacterium]
MVVLWIIVILFVALIIIVPLIEKYGPRISEEDRVRYMRWLLPLVGLLLLIQLALFLFK